MSKQPRFEVVRSDAGWFARFIAANGREVWRTSETYTRRRAALAAVYFVARPLPTRTTPWDVAALVQSHGAVEIREIDERTP